ncbi:hypothetical protein DBR17_10520 [Sphingomonas sp. HMWF008]|nr:hypothetical protein DBR17_10520 [Sphingomonas sp. HMWF008]
MVFAQTYHEENFITEDERAGLVAWARAMEPHFVDNKFGPFRRAAQIHKLPTVDPLFKVVQRRVIEAMNLSEDTPKEQQLGAYLSVISPGGAVQRHRDPTPEGTRHLRCNIFLQLPESGARPMIVDVPVSVATRSLLAFYPSELVHSSEAFGGDRERILLSFGFTVSNEHRLPIRKRQR